MKVCRDLRPNGVRARGRLNRAEYILYSLLCFPPLFVALGLPFGIAALGQHGVGAVIIACALGSLILGAMVWMGIALGVKRLHDMDMSGAHLVWICTVPTAASAIAKAAGVEFLGPVIGFGITLWLCCTPGTDGPNRFGEHES